jgi:alpha-mannosidase
LGNAVQDKSGNTIPLQKLQDGSIFFAKDVPALGTATFSIIKSKTQASGTFTISDNESLMEKWP